MKILLLMSIVLASLSAGATDLLCYVRYLPGSSGTGSHFYLALEENKSAATRTPSDAGIARFSVDQIKNDILEGKRGPYGVTFDSVSGIVADLVVAPITHHEKGGPTNGELIALDVRIGRVKSSDSKLGERLKYYNREMYLSRAHASLSLSSSSIELGIDAPLNGISDLTAVCRFE